MEQCFDRVDRALRALEEAVDTITSLEDDILKLDAYYSGDEWKADFRSDELGLLPQDLKRGVLSEDAIWDLLGRVDGVKHRMLDSLNDHKILSKQEIVRLLWDVLPDQLDDKQKNTKVYNILRKLRESGKIVNQTTGNKSVWSLAKT